MNRDFVFDKDLWSEHQLQAIQFFSMSIERMRQEKMSEYDILFWFQNFMGPYLEKVYGLKIYIGSSTSIVATPASEMKAQGGK